MDALYYDFVMNMKNKLHEEINGNVRYEVYPTVDTVIFKVRFKDFEFAYPINHISHNIYNGIDTEQLVDDFKKEYLKAIKNTFFKTEERKKRDRKREENFIYE